MNVDRPGVPIRFQSGPRQPVLSVPYRDVSAGQAVGRVGLEPTTGGL